jgi:uncharacterized protein
VALALVACGSAGGESNEATTTRAPSSTTTSSTTTTTEATTTTLPTTTVAPTTTTTTPPLLRAPSAEAPLDTLILGDSTAYEVGNALLRANTDGLFAAVVLFKTSSGLARPDFFDWAYYLDWVLDHRAAPELMILSLGANDGQDLHAPDGTIHLLPDDGWRAEYLRRVDEVSRRITEAGTTLYWVGQPLALDRQYSQAMGIINGVYEEVAARYDKVVFVDIWTVLSGPDGEYRRTIEGPDGKPLEIRAEDDIHLTEAGGDIAAALVLERLRAGWEG